MITFTSDINKMLSDRDKRIKRQHYSDKKL